MSFFKVIHVVNADCFGGSNSKTGPIPSMVVSVSWMGPKAE